MKFATLTNLLYLTHYLERKFNNDYYVYVGWTNDGTTFFHFDLRPPTSDNICDFDSFDLIIENDFELTLTGTGKHKRSSALFTKYFRMGMIELLGEPYSSALEGFLSAHTIPQE